jgi:uncharacterized protein
MARVQMLFALFARSSNLEGGASNTRVAARILPAHRSNDSPTSTQDVAAGRYRRSMRVVRLLGPRGHVFRAESPQTRRERMRGWRGRSEVSPDDVLLLDRTRSIHTFGMRLPISVALLDRELVVRSVRDVRPGRLLLPRHRIRHVLECAEGVDLRPGDRILIVGTD